MLEDEGMKGKEGRNGSNRGLTGWKRSLNTWKCAESKTKRITNR
jgi:hypothetical protein